MSSKSRFSSTDVKAMVGHIRSTVMGCRLANIYDLNDNKTYIFKFSGNLEGENQKLFLLLESGVRFHGTKIAYDKNEIPSPFTMKLRRFIRLKRLEDIKQIGTDRVVDFKFGSGEGAYHVILELYSQGNIVLTDHNYEIISLLRSHQFEEDVAIKMGEVYPMSYTTAMSTLSEQSYSSADVTEADIEGFLRDAKVAEAENALFEGAESTKASKKKATAKTMLLGKTSVYACYGPEVIDHCLHKAGVPPSTKVAKLLTLDAAVIRTLLTELKTAEALLAPLNRPQPGYIIYKDESVQEFAEFIPLMFAQHAEKQHAAFGSFEEAVDHYFGNIEAQKMEKRVKAAEENARKKVEKVTSEQQHLIETLSRAQIDMEEQAALVELFAEDVDKVCLVLNSALTSGMSWEDIAEMVRVESKKGNPVASLIAELRLDKNMAVLRLEDPYADDEDAGRVKLVEIDLEMTAFANARRLYVSRKSAKVKEQKTIEVSAKVIQNVEAAAMKALDSQKIKRNLNTIRHVYWFEKFNWFITTEGYLVLSGRDAQQNEMLVKRYLRPGDAYVHADMGGASSCIVRSKGDGTASAVISPFALQEAGAMTICRSAAWSAKALISAYWVNANQVSKSAPSGEYLQTGSFMIYGKKNYLSPCVLEMGFGIVFRLDDGSVFRHLGERKDKGYVAESTAKDVGRSYAYTEVAEPVVPEPESVVDDDVIEEDDGELDAEEGAAVSSAAVDPTSTFVLSEAEELEGVEPDEEESISGSEEVVPIASKAVVPQEERKKGAKPAAAEGEGAASTMSKYMTKKKALSKKKARRYAEQDEEDRELAMLALGHLKFGEEKQKKEKKLEETKKEEDKLAKQAKLGIKNSKKDWGVLVSSLQDKASAALNELIQCGKIVVGELDESELRSLATFSDDDATSILHLFRDGNFNSMIGNKSGFLAGIIRRYTKDAATAAKVQSAETEAAAVLSRRERKRLEEQEIQAITEEEGLIDEEVGATADELEKLTGSPTADDLLLYAVPMCGPYSAFQNVKYKVKLTPGTQKKGKAAKQALEVFLKNKDAIAVEKTLMKALTDPEMVAILIGDVKLSTPGLQQVQKAQRGQKKFKKECEN